jgi:hypothetical protein
MSTLDQGRTPQEVLPDDLAGIGNPGRKCCEILCDAGGICRQVCGVCPPTPAP